MFNKKKNNSYFNDIEIVDAILSNKANEVLPFLYGNVQPKMTKWIISNSGDKAEAQDIFQDAVIAFYRYVKTGKFEKGASVDAFIFSVGKNLWVNRVKQKNRLVSNADNHINQLMTEADFSAQIIDKEREEKIQAVLSQLGERCKQLLTYSIFHNLSMEEISQKMDFNNANTAKTKNYKCKQRLIALVKDNEYFKELLYA